MSMHKPVLERSRNGGSQKIYRFENDYGASVVKHAFSYGAENGNWELAVIRFLGRQPHEFMLCYTTDITDDVIGHLDEDEINGLLERIAALSKVEGGAA